MTKILEAYLSQRPIVPLVYFVYTNDENNSCNCKRSIRFAHSTFSKRCVLVRVAIYLAVLRGVNLPLPLPLRTLTNGPPSFIPR